MESNMNEKLDRRRRVAWAAFEPLREATDQLTDQKLRAHLLVSTVLPSLCHAAKTWADTSTTSRQYEQLTERLNVAFSISIDVHIIWPACVVQIFRVYSFFVTRGLYIYNDAQICRSSTEKNRRQMDEKKFRVDPTTMYASSRMTSYRLGGRVH
ncbi:hypothetical protein KIN20_004488 [Parelaphostrongylus tenuis]|uniref:Uncharacterized protein n=1 Tax=Parelaphostrongylus tenuis TaxID=148309 RepID=A0AAD5QF64_PARTN|nr:hypothetical protein KIN20_004488 [Parelaphostrongylus tenuis]